MGGLLLAAVSQEAEQLDLAEREAGWAMERWAGRQGVAGLRTRVQVLYYALVLLSCYCGLYR